MQYKIKVIPKAKQNKIAAEKNYLKVHLTETPENVKANKKLKRLLADHFATAKTNIAIIQGEKSAQKTVEILHVKNYNQNEQDKMKSYLGQKHCWQR